MAPESRKAPQPMSKNLVPTTEIADISGPKFENHDVPSGTKDLFSDAAMDAAFNRIIAFGIVE